jgi:7-keto-8-aminopelargonate synthetase-like enzyme
MAKITESIFNTIFEISTQAEDLGIAYQFTQNQFVTGKELQINQKSVLNFSSCSYLGLETDSRLKEAVVDFAQRYGSQFSMSRGFCSLTPYSEAEDLLGKLFDAEVVITSSTSMGHQSVLPVVVSDSDMVILDQKVHASVQLASNILKVRGVRVEMIRHNALTELEDLIKQNQAKGRKVFYCIDGVYSMFGDFAPYAEISALMQKYECLNLYIDDAHGMGWIGKNGSGYTMCAIELNERIIMGTSLNKSFAASGGVFLFKDKDLRKKVKYCGALNSFSGPIQPPMLGAIIASARIHLSDEIYSLQDSLKRKIAFTNQELIRNELPIVVVNESPIFFVGNGSPKVCFNLAKGLLNDGYFASVGAFPAVPVKNTGIRFAINNHLSETDIANMVSSLRSNFERAIEEDGINKAEIFSLFNLDYKLDKQDLIEQDLEKEEFQAEFTNSIVSIDRKVWEEKVSPGNILNYDDLLDFEKVYSGDNTDPNKWKFYYITINDKKGNPVLLALLTAAITKDDMLSSAEVSAKMEELRKKNPNYLLSKTLILGTHITEGLHFYTVPGHSQQQSILKLFLKVVYEIQEIEQANSILLRDFVEKNDKAILDFFFEEGFVKFKLPDSYSITGENLGSREAYMAQLSARNRRHLNYEVLKFQDKVDVVVKQKVTEEELSVLYRLYRGVQEKSFEINTFPLPLNLFKVLSQSESWEFVLIYSQSEFGLSDKEEIIAFALAKKGVESYVPVIVGHDYRYLYTHSNYRQCLLNAILRAGELGYKTVRIEMGAGIEKRKFGCSVEEKLVLIQSKDTYSQEMLYNLNVQGEN